MSLDNKINEEVINELISLMEKVIGKATVKIILNKVGNTENISGKDIVFNFADETQNLLGPNGAFATLRQVGRDLAKSLMEKNSKEEWKHILKTALNNFGFAEEIKKEKDSAYICNCVFFKILSEKGLTPTSHAVCWAGWGFIEGFVKELEGVKGIKWESRDEKEHRCRFVFIK